jgi:hypothetical protein
LTDTKATGKVSQQISYEVKLFIDAKPDERKKNMYSIAILNSSNGKYDKEVGVNVDLLTLNEPIHLYLEDNATWDGYEYEGKSDCYVQRGLMNLVNVSVPLRLEVKKFIANKEVPMNENDNVNAVFNVEDPIEDDIIKGRPGSLSSRNGRDFVRSIRWKTRVAKSTNDDNCIQSFAPKNFQSRCRRDGKKVRATDVLYRLEEKSKQLSPLDAHKSDANLGVAPIIWKSRSASIVFRPPPILGDNYAFKISLVNEKGEDITLRNKPKKPTITLWRRVKIRLIALQDGITYSSIKWDQVKNTYHDAFIEVEEPIRKNQVVISKENWIKYLEKNVYKTWHRKAWIAYKKKNSGQSLRDDLDSYSFPQTPSAKGVKNLTPPSESKPDPKHTADALLDKLAEVIIRASLGKKEKKQIDNLLKGARVGLCVLFCRIPSPEGVAVGMTFGWPPKMFRMLLSEDVTNTFVHEMGHTLFLNHGATKFVDVDQELGGRSTVDGSIIVHSEDSSTYGPYWDEHDSEDTVSCVMSYGSWFYDDSGSERTNSVDWHLCGVCLLYLRFYDIHKMSKDLKSNDGFRKLNYFKNKPKIAIAEEMTVGKTKNLVYWEFSNSLKMKVKERKRLLALYSKENVVNNNGKKYWKDICHHPRGKWVSSNTKNAVVKRRKRDDTWISELKALKPTSTGVPVEIKFRMKYGPNKADAIESSPLRVTVIK